MPETALPESQLSEAESTKTQRHVVVVTRYSVVDSRMQSTRSARDAQSLEDYRATLFDASRLQARFETFKAITVPSLMAQREFDGRLHFLLLISDALPQAQRVALSELMAQMSQSSGIQTRILAVAAEPNGESETTAERSIGTAIETYLHEVAGAEEGSCVATVRLDDDDGLSAGYCQRLAAYLRPELAGFVVSFPYGLQGVVDGTASRVSRLRRMYYPKVALGLALINYYDACSGWRARPRHVYGLGSHVRVDRRCPVILDAAEPAYFRAVGDYNDSGDVPFHAFLPEVVPGEMSQREFAFLFALADEGAQVAEDTPPPAGSGEIDVFAAAVDKARSRQEIEALRDKLQSARGMIGSLRERLGLQEANSKQTPEAESDTLPQTERPRLAGLSRLIQRLTGKEPPGGR